MHPNNLPLPINAEQAELWLKNKCYTLDGPYLRPFAPNPMWSTAEVFIVGFNPIGPLRHEFESFEHYWDALIQNPAEYRRIYKCKYLKTEEEKSRTSKRIAEIVDCLAPINVLVTNVYAYPAANPKHIPRSVIREPIEERILPLLLSVCKPKIILFHGREARLFANKFFNVSLNQYLPLSAQTLIGLIPSTSVISHLFAYHHFVGRVKAKATVDKQIKAWAQQVRMLLNSEA